MRWLAVGSLGGPGASGWLTGGQSQEWQVKPGPGVSGWLLAGRADSCWDQSGWLIPVWLAGPKDPQAHFRLLMVGGPGSWYSWVWGLRCPEGCVFLPVKQPGASWSQGRVWLVLQDYSLLASDVCFLVGEVEPEAYAGSLVGGASACVLVGRAGSWTSGWLGHI